MANRIVYVNLPILLLLITILTCSEQVLVRTATEEDFAGEINQESRRDLISRLTWSMSKQNQLDYGKYFDIIRRTLSVIGAIFTIWIFIETRDNQFKEQTANELLEELNLQVENLNFRLEEVQKSLLHLSRLYDASKMQKKSGINCLQSIQQDRQAATFGRLLIKSSHTVKDRQIKEKEFFANLDTARPGYSS